MNRALAGIAVCCWALTGFAAEWPDRSVYQLDSVWTNQAGQRVALPDLAGRPRVVGMFFSSCGYACPRLVDDLKAIGAALSPEERAAIGFALFSFDDEVDRPERLAVFAKTKELDPALWTLLHGEADIVRELSAVLDIPFRRMPEGGFDHANALLLLDAQGVPVVRLTGLGADPAPLLKALRDLLPGRGPGTAGISGKP